MEEMNNNSNQSMKQHAVSAEEDVLLGIKMTPAAGSSGRESPEYLEHKIVYNPTADQVDLSELRGTKAPIKGPDEMLMMKNEEDNDELEALAELVPELKSKATKEREIHTMTVDLNDDVAVPEPPGEGVEVAELPPVEPSSKEPTLQNDDPISHDDVKNVENEKLGPKVDDLAPQISREEDNGSAYDALGDDAGSETALNEDVKPTEVYPSSGASLSTATQTHEVRMPMYLATFKPATGCTNASDFIVRCFVARLRSGITVVKHGRSRWCKSRLRILHIHPDGRSLSWKPAVGEPTSSKRPPKLDLSTCEEVRHAWSPDPLNPMFTGTPILRQKCEAANAHKSFALVFPKRTVDITAVTADQCKVLMEGFSALCFRLQVANLGRPKKRDAEEEGTASVTLTNASHVSSPNTKRK